MISWACLLFLLFPIFEIHATPVSQLLNLQTLSQSVEVLIPAPRNLSSDAWRPTIFTACVPGQHYDSAPCRRVPNLIYAEELVYPDFRIRLPRFVSPDHKRIYLRILHGFRHTWLRGRVIDGYAHFLNQRGQNLVYANVTFAGKPAPGEWTNDACLSYGSHLHVRAFPSWTRRPQASGTGNPASAPAAAIFTAAPDDWSFQHFLDRVAILLAQTRHLAAPESWRYIASTRQLSAAAEELWGLLVPGFNVSTSILSPRAARAGLRLLVYPCQAPLIHPYHHQLVSELVQQAAGFDPRAVEPLASRRTVVFLAREGTRTWDNEIECRGAIESLLRQRAQGEELLVFTAEDYPTLTDVVALGRRVKLMVGVHGGAFYNMVFMQPGTALVEICPVELSLQTSRCGTAFWEMSAVRHMPYWVVLATNVTAGWQVNHLDCGLVVTAVRQALEGLGTAPSPLEPFYQGSSFA